MNSQLEQELQQLIELLLEERITPDQNLQLNKLLKQPAARDYYLNYIMLHGMLGWDAGLNCPFSKQPADLLTNSCTMPKREQASDLQKHNNRRFNLNLTVIAATVLGLLSVSVYYSGIFKINQQELAQNNNHSSDQQTNNPVHEAEQPPKDKFTPIQINPYQEKIAEHNSNQHLPDKSVEKKSPDIKTADYSDKAMVELINYELEKSWNDNGVTPSPKAEDGEWIRRVYLDLAGRIPNQMENNKYLSNSNLKRDEVIRQILSSEDFSRQFSTRWATLLVGRSQEKHAERTALRNYLQESMNSQFTWSRIFQDLLTAEGSLEENGATGFLLAHLNDMAVPATAVTCRLLLGEQLQCVQCHKHPHNDWTQEYFWEINSFFKQTKAVTTTDNNQNIVRLISEKTGGPTYYETVNGLMKITYPKLGEVKVDPSENTNRRQEFSRLLLSRKELEVSRAFVNRTWAMLFGYGFTNPIDDLGPHNPASHPELFEKLSEGFIASGYDIRRLVTWICMSDAYQRTSKLGDENSLDQPEKGETPLFSRVYLKMMSPEQLYTSMQILETEHQRMIPDLSEQEAWTEQFVIFAQNDENNEFDQSSGTVNQALELMNGDLMDEVINKSCQKVLSQFNTKSKWTEAQTQQLIQELTQSFMTRNPTPREIVIFKKRLEDQKLLQTSSKPQTREQILLATMQDFAWVLMNSSEFILIH